MIPPKKPPIDPAMLAEVRKLLEHPAFHPRDLGTINSLPMASRALVREATRGHGAGGLRCGAWSFILSFHPIIGWVFSAKLLTSGSTVEDWEQLGRMSGAVGAPREMPASCDTNPGGSHYWMWGGSAKAEHLDLMRAYSQELGITPPDVAPTDESAPS